jgi:hypothetical protein
MPSPFPGMDPYLEDERLWPTFHHQLVNALHQILLPGLTDRYSARVEQRHYDNRHEDYVEIRQRSDDRLISLIDVASPANKLMPSGRSAYLDTRRDGRVANANVVEIDLVLQGQPLLDYSRDGLPNWDYAVTVARATHPDRFEIYTSTFRKRLPRFRLPLAGDDRDTVMDLQVAFARCFDEGRFADRIDYRRDPAVPLKDDDLRWIDGLLVERQLRGRSPSHDDVAVAAYHLWQVAGCPDGRDQEHWFRAIEQLRRVREG